MRKFGLLGKKLGHSLSPFIHNILFEISGIDAEYLLYETDDVADFLQKNSDIEGFNITIPYKKDIVQFCSSLHDSAKFLGVVNCVDSNRIGYNTDVYGYNESVREICSSHNGKVLLLGCGGVGSMIAKQYLSENLTIAIRNITDEKIENIVETFGNVKVVDIANIPKNDYDLVVNSTPCGMFPNIDCSPIKKDTLKMAKACYDTIYNPYDTQMLKMAKELNIKYKNGLDMLVLQAVKSHEYWYGAKFDSEQIAEIINKTRAELENR